RLVDHVDREGVAAERRERPRPQDQRQDAALAGKDDDREAEDERRGEAEKRDVVRAVAGGNDEQDDEDDGSELVIRRALQIGTAEALVAVIRGNAGEE